MSELGVDPVLLELLRCPQAHHAVLRMEDDTLICTECGLRFPVRDGIPVMLIDEAEPAAGGAG